MTSDLSRQTECWVSAAAKQHQSEDRHWPTYASTPENHTTYCKVYFLCIHAQLDLRTHMLLGNNSKQPSANIVAITVAAT